MYMTVIWTVLMLATANAVYTKSSDTLKHHKVQKSYHGSGATPDTRKIAQPTRSDSSDPEIDQKAAQLGRYIVHNSKWVTMGTISSTSDMTGYPFANVKSMADGPKGESSGTPYFYMTPRDQTAIDLKKDNRASVALSMEQDGYCTKNGMDPESPKCGRMIIFGHVYTMEPGTENYDFAVKSLFARHPEMAHWPANHHFFVANLTANAIIVVDGIGGPKIVPVDVYYKTPPVGPDH